jgi:hypothetical protein
VIIAMIYIAIIIIMVFHGNRELEAEDAALSAEARAERAQDYVCFI